MRPSISSSLYFLGVILFSVSCQDKLIDVQSPTYAEVITPTEAQKYFEQSPLNNPVLSQAPARRQVTRESLKRTPNWDRAVTKKMGDQMVLVVPISHDKLTGLGIRESDKPTLSSVPKMASRVSLDQTSSLHFYKDKYLTTHLQELLKRVVQVEVFLKIPAFVIKKYYPHLDKSSRWGYKNSSCYEIFQTFIGFRFVRHIIPYRRQS